MEDRTDAIESARRSLVRALGALEETSGPRRRAALRDAAYHTTAALMDIQDAPPAQRKRASA